MIRAALFPVLSLLAACGGIGLDPMLADDGASFDDEAPGLEPIDVGLRGRTYAAPVSDMEVLYPSQFAVLLASASDREMLFHVEDEDSQELQIVAAHGGDGVADARRARARPDGQLVGAIVVGVGLHGGHAGNVIVGAVDVPGGQRDQSGARDDSECDCRTKQRPHSAPPRPRQ